LLLPLKTRQDTFIGSSISIYFIYYMNELSVAVLLIRVVAGLKSWEVATQREARTWSVEEGRRKRKRWMTEVDGGGRKNPPHLIQSFDLHPR
jgi:hypothetical protein